jgi:hypothetical protein
MQETITIDQSIGDTHWLTKESGALRWIIKIQADSPEEAMEKALQIPNHIWTLCFLIN